MLVQCTDVIIQIKCFVVWSQKGKWSHFSIFFYLNWRTLDCCILIFCYLYIFLKWLLLISSQNIVFSYNRAVIIFCLRRAHSNMWSFFPEVVKGKQILHWYHYVKLGIKIDLFFVRKGKIYWPVSFSYRVIFCLLYWRTCLRNNLLMAYQNWRLFLCMVAYFWFVVDWTIN